MYSFWAPDKDYPLPPMGADPNTITISGFSSGAFMSTNLNVIYSSFIKGAGLVSGGPYGWYDQLKEEELVAFSIDQANTY